MPVSACTIPDFIETDLKKTDEYLSGKRDGELLPPYSQFLELLQCSNNVFPPREGCRNHITYDGEVLVLTVHANGEMFNITLEKWDWKNTNTELSAARAEIVALQKAALK